MPFPGLFHDGPKSGAAAEIAAQLLLPQAAVDRNSQDDRRSETGGHAGPPLQPNSNRSVGAALCGGPFAEIKIYIHGKGIRAGRVSIG